MACNPQARGCRLCLQPQSTENAIAHVRSSTLRILRTMLFRKPRMRSSSRLARFRRRTFRKSACCADMASLSMNRFPLLNRRGMGSCREASQRVSNTPGRAIVATIILHDQRYHQTHPGLCRLLAQHIQQFQGRCSPSNPACPTGLGCAAGGRLPSQGLRNDTGALFPRAIQGGEEVPILGYTGNQSLTSPLATPTSRQGAAKEPPLCRFKEPAGSWRLISRRS